MPTSTQLTADEVRFLAADSGAVVLVTDARHVGGDARRCSSSAPALRDVILVDDGAHVPARRLARARPRARRWPAISALGAGASDARRGSRVPRLHLGHHGLSEGRAARAPRAPRPPAVVGVLVRLRCRRGDRVLHAGKYNWTYVLGTGLMDPLYRGHTDDRARGRHRRRRSGLRASPRHGATIFIGVPTIYRQILQKTACGARRRADAAPLHERRRAALRRGARGVARALRPRDLRGARHDRVLVLPVRDARRVPSARAPPASCSPGTTSACSIPTTLRDVPDRRGGHALHPRAPIRASCCGYWNQPEETAACFRGDWFLTGDYARLDDDGYVWFLGRRDDLINTLRLPRVAARGRARAEVPSRRRRRGGGRRRRSGPRRRSSSPTWCRARARSTRGRRAGVRARAARVVQGAAHRLPRRRPAAHAQREGPAPGAPSRAGARAGAGVKSGRMR